MSEMGAWKPESLDGSSFGAESDLPPEYYQYRDEGCELAESCLNCPFPQCVYDEHRGKQRRRKKLRNNEIARLFSDESKEVKELATIFGVSQRTIQRALKSSLLTAEQEQKPCKR